VLGGVPKTPFRRLPRKRQTRVSYSISCGFRKVLFLEAGAKIDLMPIGTCKLCLRADQELQKSHLMPAGMYRRLLSKERNPHPLLVTAVGSRLSSLHVTDYVLCRECESRFDEGGENYTLRFAADNGRFRLLEELQATRPSLVTREWNGYTVTDAPEIKRAQLAYFALSVFWRTSVHTWQSTDGTGKLPGITLGKQNNENLRQFLLGESPRPTTVSLFFVVLSDNLSQSSFNLPTMTHKGHSLWSYGFFACGLLFILTIGKHLPPAHVRCCLMQSTEQWIWARDGSEKTLQALSSLISKQPPGVTTTRF
jgi:hypothetical protein